MTLNGTPRSGDPSIAVATQASLGGTWIDIGVDAAIAGLLALFVGVRCSLDTALSSPAECAAAMPSAPHALGRSAEFERLAGAGGGSSPIAP